MRADTHIYAHAHAHNVWHLLIPIRSARICYEPSLTQGSTTTNTTTHTYTHVHVHTRMDESVHISLLSCDDRMLLTLNIVLCVAYTRHCRV